MATKPGAKRYGPRRQETDENGRTKYIRYSRPLAAEIARRVGQGESWYGICARDGMPSYHTLYSWRAAHPEFAEALGIAREEAAERKAHRALEVAEAAQAGVPGDRLRVSLLMQLAALEAPHVYGAKAARGGGGDGEGAGKPQQLTVVFRIRDFDLVTDPDGTERVVELTPDGER